MKVGKSDSTVPQQEPSTPPNDVAAKLRDGLGDLQGAARPFGGSAGRSADKPPPVGYIASVALPIEPPAGFEDLPVPEKIAYVQALWDLIADNQNEVPVPAWHKEVLDERLAEIRSGSAASRPWAEVRADLRARLRKL